MYLHYTGNYDYQIFEAILDHIMFLMHLYLNSSYFWFDILDNKSPPCSLQDFFLSLSLSQSCFGTMTGVYTVWSVPDQYVLDTLVILRY